MVCIIIYPLFPLVYLSILLFLPLHSVYHPLLKLIWLYPHISSSTFMKCIKQEFNTLVFQSTGHEYDYHSQYTHATIHLPGHLLSSYVSILSRNKK